MFVQFDGIGAVFLMEWIYNDQYKQLKYDIPTGNVVQYSSGSSFLNGVNSSYVLFVDGVGNVNQIPKNGGQYTPVISVPYPLELSPHWLPSGNGFYFIIAYMDPTKGYFSEINYIEQVK